MYIYSENFKNFLSENARSTALIFDIVHYLMDLYQFYSNNGPGASNEQSFVRETTLGVVAD